MVDRVSARTGMKAQSQEWDEGTFESSTMGPRGRGVGWSRSARIWDAPWSPSPLSCGDEQDVNGYMSAAFQFQGGYEVYGMRERQRQWVSHCCQIQPKTSRPLRRRPASRGVEAESPFTFAVHCLTLVATPSTVACRFKVPHLGRSSEAFHLELMSLLDLHSTPPKSSR